MHFTQRMKETLAERSASDSYRQRKMTKATDLGRMIEINGARYLNFSSNDYLGLSQAPEVVEAWKTGADLYGVGSAGSGHITGYNEALANLENKLASWLGYDRAIVYPSGFTANQAVIKALIEKEDRIVADRLSHASLMEASMMVPGRLTRFHHNDLDSLQKRMNALPDGFNGGTLVITEGLFSMDGDEAPLREIFDETARHDNSWLMVDDAHGIGVNGEKGRGTCAKHGIKPDLLIVTFGKAFGLSGAALLCSDLVAEYFTQVSRPLIYSTAIPPAQAYTLHEIVKLIEVGDDRRAQLRQNIDQFKTGLIKMGIEPISDSAIQPIIIGGNDESLQLATKLQERGIWITAIRPPTVPPNSARLRITLTAAHTESDIAQLLETFANVYRG
ncbi:8-amino-7-oxononanoate synthase [Ignatzschineria sp. RMDPL8A]|uniref:8-amino-7-oxononanoate synthase n=1 Tax=Ignatzschineria sp. RMDPL8A TaxID=2999236 RepID=UPI0024466924|nr:8-amino-7-oxononanoate synthase [Ignatzschineria sp. RMDPL8A]MDG9730641.1 8-amino-7-oxononanoate synthase [Ignatzschineria sp. RMDPL8A]